MKITTSRLHQDFKSIKTRKSILSFPLACHSPISGIWCSQLLSFQHWSKRITIKHKNSNNFDWLTYINTRFERVPDASCGDAAVVDVGQACGSPESHLGSEIGRKFLKNKVQLKYTIEYNKLLNTQQRSHYFAGRILLLTNSFWLV